MAVVKRLGIENAFVIDSSVDRYVDDRGMLSVFNVGHHVPFTVQRIFYIEDVPEATSRGNHAHLSCHQFLLVLNGSCRVTISDGCLSEVVTLSRDCPGLYIPPGIWGCQEHYSDGAQLMVFASHDYDPDDYIHDFGEFLRYRNGG